ncbi:basic proline-rich protein-like [Phalacrocorax carbo]|uniref:basic proline-rich protein-like n=1 Tax=Phalacrocorax carbo TaxID=9209 RepID=UPI003119F1BB
MSHLIVTVYQTVFNRKEILFLSVSKKIQKHLLPANQHRYLPSSRRPGFQNQEEKPNGSISGLPPRPLFLPSPPKTKAVTTTERVTKLPRAASSSLLQEPSLPTASVVIPRKPRPYPSQPGARKESFTFPSPPPPPHRPTAGEPSPATQRDLHRACHPPRPAPPRPDPATGHRRLNQPPPTPAPAGEATPSRGKGSDGGPKPRPPPQASLPEAGAQDYGIALTWNTGKCLSPVPAGNEGGREEGD